MAGFLNHLVRTRILAYWLIILSCLCTVDRALAVGQCSSPANAIVAENCLPGNPSSEWDIGPNSSGDATIQGFATDISVNQGGTVAFKIKTDAKAYSINIYRLGYYGGMGARKVATVSPAVPLPQAQPACLTDAAAGLADCGNWGVSATWQVPTTATSGVYIAHLVRTDTAGDSHIVFIVRNDSGHSAILYQTSDEAWQAYNYYGSGSLYGPAQPTYNLNSRSYKVSYNRPFLTRGFGIESDTWVFGPEFPMIQWLEQNGYDVAYFTGVDAARSGALIKNHKVYMDSGHDEYWSGPHRTNVEAARDAGVNLAFFSGNGVFWKTRWENSIDGTNTAFRTLVCYKETLAFAKIDPNGQSTWTGTWRDPSFSPPGDGGNPENGLTGTSFLVNGIGSDNDGSMKIQVPYSDGQMRLWRNTAIASLAPNATYSMPAGTLGFEWDTDPDNGRRPAGLFDLATSKHVLTTDYLLDQGATYGAGTATHHLTEYRAPSGALVFGSGTVDWSWGLNSNHDNPFSFATPNPDLNMQQATVNLFADMGVQPATLQSGLVTAAQSTDTAPPVSHIASPASGATLNTGTAINVSGTATDSGGAVAGVEISGDGGATWHPATGRGTWSYSFIPRQAGQTTLLARAVDDSGNLEAAEGIPITVVPQVCPCSVWNSSSVPGSLDSGDTQAVEVGLKFRADSDGSVLGVRFYKAALNAGTHVGHLWSSSGALLGTATFNSESSAGWQQVNFSQPIPVTSNATYVVSYFAPQGHYSADSNAFAQSGVDNPPLHALANGVDGSNGVYIYTSQGGVFPNNSFSAANYWVDVVYTSSNTYTVGGTLSGPGGSGALVTINGPQTLTTNADSSGSYAFDGVTNGSYTVTPSRSGVTFSPLSRSVSVNGAAVTAVNFTATVTSPLNISGNVANGAGASVALSGAANASTTADATGNFAFSGLLSGSYVVTPTLANTLFTPASQSVTLTSSDATQVNFQGQTCVCTSIWQPSATPAVIDANDRTPVELGLKFRSDVSGVVNGVRFYKSAANVGSHIGHLWTTSGTLLGSVTFTNETASGWQQAVFASPLTIAANTTYIVSYYAPSGHYSADASYLASQGVDNAPLHALANGTDGPNGIYLYTSSPGGGFPSNTYASTNYWVDVLFVAAQSHRISGTISGANGPNATIALTGSASATTTADALGNYSFSGVYAGTYAVTPASAVGFLPGTQSVTVSSTDVTGVNFATSTNCPCNSIWLPSVKPTKIDAQDGSAVELGTKFTADNDGYILGIRFYKAATNTGQHVVSLWDPGTKGLLATASATGESVSGWQQVLFATPVPISANTQYMASYFAPIGHYSGDGGFFASSGADNAPLHGSANTTSSPNGVYSYSTNSGYPASTYNATNYWVDVLYSTASRYAIGGTISGTAGSPASVALSGPVNTTATTDSNGNFSFVNLQNGTYTVTPTLSGSVMTPSSQTITVNGAHVLGVNFVAAQTTYTLSGTVTGAANDTVALSGPVTQSVIADAAGKYTFTGLSNGTYTVTPGTNGFSVTPGSQTVTISSANASGVNFTATAQTFTVAGTIAGGGGATVALTGGSGGSSVADASGNYSFAGVTNGTYIVTPSKSGLVFSPTSISVTVQSASVLNANFMVPPNCPCDTLWQPTATPGTTDSVDPHAGEYGVKFRADADGYIAGIRFYKSSANSGTHAGTLWSSTGKSLGTATFTSESATGWQQVMFASPVPVTANTTYVASYFAPAGHYSSDAGFFASQGVESAPLHALANGVDGPNGLYIYSAVSAFPTSSFNSGNYWVDVVYLPTTTYSVGGMITGPGAVGATLTLTGGSGATATTDASGAFSFSGLGNGSYTLTPSKPGYTFSPVSQNITISNGHALGVSFSSISQTFILSGTIAGPGGSGATVSLTGTSSGSVIADASGAYAFPSLPNGSYTITPSQTGYVMSPASQTVAINGADTTANFSAASQTFSVSGTIAGAGGAGATVALSGASAASTTANASGGYTFAGLVNGSYTVTPSRAGYVMSPASQTVIINGASVAADFSAGAQTYVLNGTITGPGGAGATVNLTGASTASTTADGAGSFSFAGLANGSYTVTPTKTGYVMTPSSQAVTISGANATATFSSAATFALSGTISGAGGSGATVSLTGASTATVTANSSGAYSFTGLTNGSYTVNPARTGYLMSPISQSVAINGANAVVNFSSVAVYTLSGTITGAGASGATVKLTGAAAATVIADATGAFAFANLPNGSYTVTPSQSGYSMTPTSRAVTINGANVSTSFTSQPLTYTISGTISGFGGSRATVTLSGAANAQVTANLFGAYRFNGVLSGSYVVTPTKNGFTMTPVSQAVTVVNANVTANFTAK